MLGLRMTRRKGEAQPVAAPAAPAGDPTALPSDLAMALENATVLLRASDDSGQPRGVIQIDGRGWVHSQEGTRQALLARWPALTDAQLQRAVRMAGNLVRRASRETIQRRENWVQNW